MAEKLDPKELVSFDELLMSQVIQLDALINLFDRKGIISKQELLEEIKKVKTTLPEKQKNNKRINQISKEEAIEIAIGHIGSPVLTEITDEWNDSWSIYSTEKLTNCWYVLFSPFYSGLHLGASRMIAISKENGRILGSGMVGE